MRVLFGIAAAALVAAAAATSASAADSMGPMMSAAKPFIVTPSTIKWQAGTGAFKGLTVAMLQGDPTEDGAWVVRLKIPAGAKFPVHFHPDTESVTVISGAFWAAIGDTYDASKLTALPPGSFAVIPAGLKHYAATKVDTIIQLAGTKPFSMKMSGSM